MCSYQCHCADAAAGCERMTGVCNSGICAEGWGGYDCQRGIVIISQKCTSLSAKEMIQIQCTRTDVDARQTEFYQIKLIKSYNHLCQK